MLPKLPIGGLPPIKPAARTTISPPASNPKAKGGGLPNPVAAGIPVKTTVLPPIIRKGWEWPKGMELSGPQFFKDPHIEARKVLPDEFKAAGLEEAFVVFNEIDTANEKYLSKTCSMRCSSTTNIFRPPTAAIT
jgi:hypothetical protein